MAMIFCYECGKKISSAASACPHCGAVQNTPKATPAGASKKQAVAALLLCLFLGCFGAHRFYVGKIGSAVAMLILSITLVGLLVTWVWAFVDLIIIACGNFTDADGRELKW